MVACLYVFAAHSFVTLRVCVFVCSWGGDRSACWPSGRTSSRTRNRTRRCPSSCACPRVPVTLCVRMYPGHEVVQVHGRDGCGGGVPDPVHDQVRHRPRLCVRIPCGPPGGPGTENTVMRPCLLVCVIEDRACCVRLNLSAPQAFGTPSAAEEEVLLLRRCAGVCVCVPVCVCKRCRHCGYCVTIAVPNPAGAGGSGPSEGDGTSRRHCHRIP